MKPSDIHPMPEYFDRYINLVEDVDLKDAFQNSLEVLDKIDQKNLDQLGDKVYAPGKWTVKDTLQHIMDTERILSYRTLRFARAGKIIPEGYDEKELAQYANAEKRTITELFDELKAVRHSTIKMFQGFDEETLLRKGVNWKYEMSVFAMGFLIIGHQAHHLKILKEKYFPLLTEA